MNVAAVQFEPTRGPAARNLPALVPLVASAAAGADLVVCPEMATTGYLWPDPPAARAVAEPARGPTLDALAPIARAHRCWLVCGFLEAAGQRLFNSALLVDPDGALAFVYRKTLLYAPDWRWASPGDSGYAVVDTGAGRLGLGICMDLNDDRFLAYAQGAAVDVLAFPTNWVHEPEVDVHGYWRERLAPTRATLVAANRWGSEDEVVFSGHSAVLRADAVVAAGPRVGDAVVRATVA